ncbi:MAG: PQQ-binding-like beta-propeller repeat protein [Gammaproteobacteria bacterium]|nr:PQQ-binding-like beta-propeller repeat protein [Gammaproteobacteria bacterium]
MYIPALDMPFAYGNQPAFEYDDSLGRWNTGVTFDPGPAADPDIEDSFAGMMRGYVSAWDPVEQEEVWRIQHAGGWNGGMLATGGNLIFQGTSHGQMKAYAADDGETLWSAPAQTGVIAPPVTYMVDGEQYVTVVAGWGGAFALSSGEAAERIGQKSRGRILTYKLGGDAELPPLEPAAPIPEPPPMKGTEQQVAKGRVLYGQYRGVCHGAGVQGGRHSRSAAHVGRQACCIRRHRPWRGPRRAWDAALRRRPVGIRRRGRSPVCDRRGARTSGRVVVTLIEFWSPGRSDIICYSYIHYCHRSWGDRTIECGLHVFRLTYVPVVPIWAVLMQDSGESLCLWISGKSS